jgi:hypothetical protein
MITLTVKGIYFQLSTIEENKNDEINLITDPWIKKKKESTFGVLAKFDSRINSSDRIIREDKLS